MGARVLVLLSLLFLRLVIGGAVSQRCRYGQQVRLSGNLNYINQTDTKTVGHLGNFILRLPEKPRLWPGDFVSVVGTCHRRVINFLLSQTELQVQQIEAITPKQDDKKNQLVRWRDQLADRIRRQLPEPEAGLVAGVVLGAKSSLTREFYDRLIATGTVQIVVASGYNLSLVAIFLSSWLWFFLAKGPATVLTVAVLWLYAQVTGGEPPVTRAWLMASLVLLAPHLGRRLPGWYVLFLSVWLILFYDPAMLTSISFQLSAAATAGLIFLSPVVNRYLEGLHLKRLLGALSADLASTLAAQVTTAPVIFWHFGRISWLAPAVNALIAPLIAPLTLAGFASLGESFLLPYGGIVSLSTMLLAKAVIGIINWFGA